VKVRLCDGCLDVAVINDESGRSRDRFVGRAVGSTRPDKGSIADEDVIFHSKVRRRAHSNGIAKRAGELVT
jgi:hypothetical protein